jgi:glycosyltransferase involved in cell wall biosynthesis
MDGHCLRETTNARRLASKPFAETAGTPETPRALVVSSVYAPGEMSQRIGREAYSYRFVFDAFAPLLRRWGSVSEVTQAESRLDYALWRERRQGLAPLHLSFLPLHMTYLSRRAPNVAFPFWEFPDIPNQAFDNNLRNNWVHIADQLDLILTACTFTRDAFLRAGVKTPVRVVPVPIPQDYFAVPAWAGDQRRVIDSPCYVFPQPAGPVPAEGNPWLPTKFSGLSLKGRTRFIYKSYIAPRLPPRLDKCVLAVARSARDLLKARMEEVHIPFPRSPQLELSGVVYTSILNPFDPRKNWEDLLSAFLLALGDHEDATLVVKLVVPPQLAAAMVNAILHHYHRLGIPHRCKLAFLTGYLSETQMVELARGSTFYVNSARAEGSCLPLQSFLAAGRPGLAPAHTALADYFSQELGFVVDSHPEPACWPHDPHKKITTRWQRLVWQSLHDQFRTSYEVARHDRKLYHAMARRGAEHMADYASAERVWPKLAVALDAVAEGTDAAVKNETLRTQAKQRLAS